MKQANASLVDRLQELPVEHFEKGGKLGYSDSAPVITIRLDQPKLPKRPEGLALIPNKASHTINYYYTRIIFPHLMCFPTGDPVAVEALRLKQDDEGLKQGVRDLSKLARSRLYYKLTKLDGRELSPFYVCRVHHGPWSAVVTEEESCYLGVPNIWTLTALGGEISMLWEGAWSDIPPFPNLTVFMTELTLDYPDRNNCCPGYQWCNGGCSPIIDDCKPVIPI
jgi:hypothetical protein